MTGCCLCLRLRLRRVWLLRCLADNRGPLCLFQHHIPRRQTTISGLPKLGLRAITPLVETLPERRTPRLVLRTFSANRSIGAHYSESSDTGRVVMEVVLGSRRLLGLRMAFKNPPGQCHQGMALHRGRILLLLMLGRRSALDLSIRHRLLLLIGIISHGRVSDCCYRSIRCDAMLTICSMFYRSIST